MRDNAKSGALTEVTFLILISLYTSKHGYRIMKSIEKETQGRLILGAGSLYGAIKTLQKRNWIMPVDHGNGRKKEYVITKIGKEIVEAEIKRLKNLISIAQEITGSEEK